MKNYCTFQHLSFQVVDMIFLYKKQVNFNNLKSENILEFLKSLTTELWILLTHPKNELERIALYQLWINFFSNLCPYDSNKDKKIIM